MKFYNDFDIEMALRRHANHPVLSKATRVLAAVAEDANNNSDGWHSWPLPCRACKQLITIIESGDATEAQLRKAMAPIKAFYTRAHAGQYGGAYPAFREVP
jgi:hypothetical protein